MPRQYTQRAFIGGNITKADDINEELSTAAGESNGLLDQNNMPLSSVVADRMVEPVPSVEVDNSAVSRFYVAHTYMPSQSYHVSENYDINPEDATFYSTSYNEIDWRLGWMKLSEKRTTPVGGTNYYAGAELSFNAQEGMIVGEVLVDAEWRASWRDIRYLISEDPETFDNITVLTQDNYIELGVFVNDVCVARTDLQWQGGRFSYVIPYSTPIGTTGAVVDVRFRIFFSNKFVTQTQGTVTASAIAPFKVYDSSIWARNQYR
jgi:hypothetical protein